MRTAISYFVPDARVSASRKNNFEQHLILAETTLSAKALKAEANISV